MGHLVARLRVLVECATPSDWKLYSRLVERVVGGAMSGKRYNWMASLLEQTKALMRDTIGCVTSSYDGDLPFDDRWNEELRKIKGRFGLKCFKAVASLHVLILERFLRFASVSRKNLD